MIHYVQIKDGVVVNRTVANEPMPLEWFPEGETWRQDNEPQIGWAYDGRAFAAPERKIDPEPPPPPDPIRAELDALKQRIDKLEASRIDIRK